jgi:hypothetical protein
MNTEEWSPILRGVLYPAMRNEVIGALESLSDPEYQQRVWVEKQFPSPTYYDDFDMAIHTLYDDTGIADDARSQIGSTLRDETEARLVQDVISALDDVLAESGDDADFESVRASKGWPHVVSTAAAALSRLRIPLDE